ncbi:MAG: hypothetical protein IT290_05255, partial [Deltaproteobacteria bacterium]|nr:hypothetical protein [Deltaproteobacteria bacterium]
AAIVVFASTNPYLLLETEKVAEDFEYQSYWVREGLPGIQMDFGWRWLFLFALRYGAGLGVCAFALVGAWALLKRQNPTGAQSPNASLFAKLHSYFSGRETFWCCLVIVVLMSIPLLRSKLLFFRYVLLFMPVLCAFAAVGVDEMARRVPAAWRSSMLLGGVAVCILDPAIRISRTGFLLSELDTRTEAKQWIEEHIPPNTPLGSHSTYYYGKPQLAYGYSFPDARLAECGSNPNECLEWVIIDEHPVRMFSPELTPEEKSALATRYDRVYDVHPVREGGYRTGLYDPSDAFYVPIASGADVIRPGTTLSIYRRKGGVGTR